MKKLAVLVFSMILFTPGVAFADDPEGETNGPFSPTFYDSPVTVVICAVPDACTF